MEILRKSIQFMPEGAALLIIVFSPYLFYYADVVIGRRIQGRPVVQRINLLVLAYCRYYADFYLLVSGGMLTLLAILKNLALSPEKWKIPLITFIVFYIVCGVALVGLLYHTQRFFNIAIKASDYETQYRFFPPRSRRYVFYLRLLLATINLSMPLVIPRPV